MRINPTRWTLLLGALIVLLFASPLLLRAVGEFLRYKRPPDLRPADIIVPLGSVKPFRAMEAAALFHQGLAPHILVAKPIPPSYMRQMRARGYAIRDPQDMALEALQRLNVPDAAITLLPDTVASTDTELESVGRYARSKGYSRVLLVTSWYHARRANLIWRIRVGTSPVPLIHLLSPELAAKEGVEPGSWWYSPLGWELVMHEYLGLTLLVLRHPFSLH